MKFEDFLKPVENDLFERAEALNAYLNSGELTGNEGLGLALMAKTSPNVMMLEKDGSQHEVIMMGSNSYLNLTEHPRVVEAAEKALKKYGYGMGAVSLYAGLTDLHKQLEKEIANFYHTEDTIVFPSGYGTNVGVISALCHEGDVIINDSANHASIFDGSLLSHADLKIYQHSNMKHLEKVLASIPENQKGRLIITDGVFSMHGDLAKLDDIVALAKKYHARVMVDDAHGLGIVGPTGRGTAEYYNLMNEVDLHVGMLSKAPGALGGYCAAKKEIIQYLRLYARTYFFSTALPAPIVAGLIEVFHLLSSDSAGREKLWQNINYMKDNLRKAGFKLGESNSGIIPVIVGDEERLFAFHNELRQKGVYTNIVSYPAVRRKECRLRLCIMKDLTKEIMDKATQIISEVGKNHGVI